MIYNIMSYDTKLYHMIQYDTILYLLINILLYYDIIHIILYPMILYHEYFIVSYDSSFDKHCIIQNSMKITY